MNEWITKCINPEGIKHVFFYSYNTIDVVAVAQLFKVRGYYAGVASSIPGGGAYF